MSWDDFEKEFKKAVADLVEESKLDAAKWVRHKNGHPALLMKWRRRAHRKSKVSFKKRKAVLQSK